MFTLYKMVYCGEWILSLNRHGEEISLLYFPIQKVIYIDFQLLKYNEVQIGTK